MIESVLERLDTSSLLAGGSLFHMRCSAHILNLIVKDGLDEIKAGVGKVRDSVAYWTATPKREERFEETARQLRNPNTKKLGLDCVTRWNSTYLMLETALLYKDVFTRLSHKEPQYKTLPSPEEWEFAKEVCGKLKPFYKATEIFSGTKYPTANTCFINILKFEKYWDVIHGIVGVSTVLDPRYKLEVLEFYFDKLFGSRALVEVDITNFQLILKSIA
ncbi:hypothetical protein DCAR_0830386 [Daucus carota subsp. sativus]|uniref:hAT-like transposase RNase-H fold domain-containing protein n=1 Tax=Daucus carota subsp. sativus TaxID=79200 RepID=A0AAF1B933_DAUCS|nr:hypothetical protein DCAR_0830386 [Daucus carota subsp. sativus]